MLNVWERNHRAQCTEDDPHAWCMEDNHHASSMEQEDDSSCQQHRTGMIIGKIQVTCMQQKYPKSDWAQYQR